MPKYLVEFKRTGFLDYEVEAKDEDEAEEIAYELLKEDKEVDFDEDCWELHKLKKINHPF